MRASPAVQAFSILLLLLAVAPTVGAEPLPRESLPPSLKPWVPWALDGFEERLCPALAGSAVCLWPGRLTIDELLHARPSIRED